MTRPALAWLALIAALAAVPAAAQTSTACGVTLPGAYYLVGLNQHCTAPGGTYNSVIDTNNPSGFGFAASAGGTLAASGGVTIATPNAIGVFATGAGSSIDTSAGQTVTTTGANATGVQADAGGVVTLGAGSVTTSGDGALGLFATGAASQIGATDVNVSTSGGGLANAVLAANGGAVTLNGGSANTSGLDAFAVAATSGGTVKLTGTAITVSGAGSGGLVANGSASAITGDRLTILVTGQVDTASGFYPVGVDSQSFQTYIGGGTITLTNTAITVGGDNGAGIFTADNGATSLKVGSIAMSGAGGQGVNVTSGGSVTLTGVQISTTGAPTASGVDAYGANNSNLTGNGATTGGGALTLNNVTIQTQGRYAYGVATGNGGQTGMVGGSIATSGNIADGVFGFAASQTRLSGVTIATTGDGAKGISIHSGASVIGDGLTITTAGARDAATNFPAEGVYNGSGPTNPLVGAGTVVLTNTTVLTTGQYGYALDTENGGVTSFSGGSLTTQGAEADGALAIGGSNVTLTGVQIAASGNSSKGLNVEGTGTVLTGTNLTISTSGVVDPATGFGFQGVYNGSAKTPGAQTTGGGRVTLTDSAVTTSGVNATGVQTANNGVTKFFGGSIVTSGGGAIALLSQSGASTTVALDTASNASRIETSGLSATAVVANTGGAIALTGASVTTTGDGATGLAVTDAGSSLTATGVTVKTSGGPDSATGFNAVGVYNGASPTGTAGGALTLTNVGVTTGGLSASGLQTQNGGASTVTAGAFATSGADAPAVKLSGAGSIGINGAALTTTGDGAPGLVINGSGGTVTASNLTISTAGGVYSGNGSHADGIYNGAFGSISGGGAMTVTDTVVKTSGYQAYGVSVGSGGTTAFYGGSVATSGSGAIAARASNGGSLTLAPNLLGVPTTLSTAGPGAYAVVADGGGAVSVTGANIATTQDGSGGIGVNGPGSRVDATNVTIATVGALDSVSGLHAYGVYNGPDGSFTTGGVLNLSNVTISTQGAGMYGVFTDTGGVTSYLDGAVTTAGAGAHGLYAGGGGSLDAEAVRVTTSGEGAYGAYVNGGGTLTLGQNASLTTSGANANALDVSGPGSTATLNGGVSLTATGANAAGLWVDSGGAVTIHALSLNSANDGISVNGASAVSAPGTVYLTTTSNVGAALKLSGDGATFNGAGGGTISAAGQAIALLNGANQTASFTGYSIQSASDLVFADPSTSTVNFTRTTANAGTGNLLNATNQSDVALNALASSLIGAIATDATSTTNVSLSGGTTWTVSGNSTVTNLNVNGSSVVFAPSANGAFKTLTVNNYVGANAAMTFNASIAGPSLGADQLVVNGGKATGRTLVSIHAVPDPPSTATPTSGTPLITTANGGSIAPGAFTLAGPVAANGFYYTLQEQNGSDVLIANQGLTQSQANASLSTLAQAKQAQAVASRVLGSILTGATEQINCSSCSSGFASFGSFALGVHGRWTLSPSLAILAGGSYDSYSDRGVRVNNSYQLALAARYDMVQLGHYRPFFEAGVAVTPYANITFSRAIVSSLAPATATGNAQSHAETVYGRIGYIWRVSPRDEVAAYSDLSRSWDSTSGYTETTTGLNPFGATVGASLDTLNVWRIGAQYTHLFGEHVEANVDAGFAQAFDARFGTSAAIGGFGAASGVAPADFHWFELGGRLSYRFARNLTGDAFVLGTLGAEPAGSQVHGGLALRLAF